MHAHCPAMMLLNIDISRVRTLGVHTPYSTGIAHARVMAADDRLIAMNDY
jgi:hypothetical protein